MDKAARAKSEEIDRNLGMFIAALPSMLPDHEGQYVLLRHGEVIGFFSTALDAQIAGNRAFDDRMFSIQHVTATAEELGFFAYAFDFRAT